MIATQKLVYSDNILDWSIDSKLKVAEGLRLRLKLGVSEHFKLPEKFDRQLNKWTKEWEIFVDGSAYFGQINKDEEKDGLGKEISILGCFKYGLFLEDEFIEGIIIKPNGEFYVYQSQNEDNLKLKICEEDSCFTPRFALNNGDIYMGKLKNGLPHGLGVYYFGSSSF